MKFLNENEMQTFKHTELKRKKNVKCYVSVTLIKSIFVDLQYEIHMVYCTAKT